MANKTHRITELENARVLRSVSGAAAGAMEDGGRCGRTERLRTVGGQADSR